MCICSLAGISFVVIKARGEGANEFFVLHFIFNPIFFSKKYRQRNRVLKRNLWGFHGK